MNVSPAQQIPVRVDRSRLFESVLVWYVCVTCLRNLTAERATKLLCRCFLSFTGCCKACRLALVIFMPNPLHGVGICETKWRMEIIDPEYSQAAVSLRRIVVLWSCCLTLLAFYIATNHTSPSSTDRVCHQQGLSLWVPFQNSATAVTNLYKGNLRSPSILYAYKSYYYTYSRFYLHSINIDWWLKSLDIWIQTCFYWQVHPRAK